MRKVSIEEYNLEFIDGKIVEKNHNSAGNNKMEKIVDYQ